MIFCTCDFITHRSIGSYQAIFKSIPVEDKLATPAVRHLAELTTINCLWNQDQNSYVCIVICTSQI